MKSDKVVWKLRWKLFKIRCREVYMRYIKILLLAVIEVIAELWNSKNKKE